jgi:hypothetical protein
MAVNRLDEGDEKMPRLICEKSSDANDWLEETELETLDIADGERTAEALCEDLIFAVRRD